MSALTTSPIVPFAADHVPSLLRDRAQWVLWKYETRDGKPTKVPYSVATGRRASPTDPATWCSFDNAVSALHANKTLYSGVGVVLTRDDSIVGIDLDDCLDEWGRPSHEAMSLVADFASYTEITPSGNGLRIFIVGEKPSWAKCTVSTVPGIKKIEIYDAERYFTITGRRFGDEHAEVAERSQMLEVYCHRYWPPQEKPPAPPRQHTPVRAIPSEEVADVLVKMFTASNGEDIRKLYEGDTSRYDGDDSRADAALCAHLAFWTGKDAGLMDRVFRQSRLFRAKWDEKRGQKTYGEITIANAIKNCGSVYDPNYRSGTSKSVTPAAETEADAPEQGAVALGQRDPSSKRLVLSPKRTPPTAEAYLREFNAHPDGRTLHNFGGIMMEWCGNRYREAEDESIKHRLQPWLHKACRYQLNGRSKALELVPFESNPTTVKAALDTIRTHTHLSVQTVTPSWLDGKGESEERPRALELLPCKTLTLHIPTGRILSPTPALFNFNALDFDYDPEPECPGRWIKFLEQLFGDDMESVELLQEFMGYCLTADTSQQKMLFIVGPKRSGKGTIGRILTRLVGEANVVGPTTSSLASQFGLQPLIGKSLAIVSDARFGGENVGAVIERLLCISGEDELSVDRKFLGAVNMKLSTRFVFFSNELPRLTDASAALAGRFMILKLTQSFFGHENTRLTRELLQELPGILLWAIEGWKRLQKRGRFVQPASSEESVSALEDLASPVSSFVRDCCTVGVGLRVNVDVLYQEWRSWCAREGRDYPTAKNSFGRDLTAAFPTVRHRRSTNMAAFYDGIDLGTGRGGL